MNKQTKIVLTVLIILFLGILVLAYLNQQGLGNSKEAQENATILFQIQDENGAVTSTFTADRDFIQSLPTNEFPTVIRSSGKKPENAIYKGVPFVDLLAALKFDLTGKEQMVVRSADGYTVAVNLSEVLQPNNAYLVYILNGEEMKSMKEGGNGPYQLILRGDPFSQRWGKYVTEVLFK